MFEGLKRLFSGRAPAAPPEWADIGPWAEARDYTFREVPGAGFVLEGQFGTIPWRLEWGPSQRAYIQGSELRLRAELGLPPELQVVVMNRLLQEAMEKTVFEQFVEGVQTRIDNETPPEMRWLVMHPKLSGSALPEPLRDRYAALSSVRRWLVRWLDGPLTTALAGLGTPPDLPVVLMIGRGRLSLRMAMPEVQIAGLQASLRLFESALRETRRLADEVLETEDHPTSPSLWPNSTARSDAVKS